MSFETNESVVAELKMFTENDGDIYRSTTTSILKNLTTKKAQGKYDSDRAVQAFMYLAEAGARKYSQEFGSGESRITGSPWHEMFPMAVRRAAAIQWRDEFEEEFRSGNYDHLIPKKYQAASRKKPPTCPDCKGTGSRKLTDRQESQLREANSPAWFAKYGKRCMRCSGYGTLS
jgi:hypothetical protein